MNANAIWGQYPHRRKRLIVLERLTRLMGLTLLGFYCCAQLYTFVLSRVALYAINTSLAALVSNVQGAGAGETPNETDYTLWSKARIRAYRALAHLKLDTPVAVLTIPRLRLTAPVFEGTGTTALNLGLGRIAGTAALGASGNVGIAGHRDGFFRALKDIEPGDLIQIQARGRQDIYEVAGTKVVDRREVNVLQPTSFPSLTLVTCYPFYFVGDAPERFVVNAVLRQRTWRAAQPLAAITKTPTSARKPTTRFPRRYDEL